MPGPQKRRVPMTRSQTSASKRRAMEQSSDDDTEKEPQPGPSSTVSQRQNSKRSTLSDSTESSNPEKLNTRVKNKVKPTWGKVFTRRIPVVGITRLEYCKDIGASTSKQPAQEARYEIGFKSQPKENKTKQEQPKTRKTKKSSATNTSTSSTSTDNSKRNKIKKVVSIKNRIGRALRLINNLAKTSFMPHFNSRCILDAAQTIQGGVAVLVKKVEDLERKNSVARTKCVLSNKKILKIFEQSLRDRVMRTVCRVVKRSLSVTVRNCIAQLGKYICNHHIDDDQEISEDHAAPNYDDNPSADNETPNNNQPTAENIENVHDTENVNNENEPEDNPDITENNEDVTGNDIEVETLNEDNGSLFINDDNFNADNVRVAESAVQSENQNAVTAATPPKENIQREKRILPPRSCKTCQGDTNTVKKDGKKRN